MVWAHEGTISPSLHREYGHANLDFIAKDDGTSNCLLKDLTNTKVFFLIDWIIFYSWFFLNIRNLFKVWMSHGDHVTILPECFKKIASTKTAPFAAISHKTKDMYGIQFHPEVTHSVQGKQILKNFVISVCKCENDWKMENFVDRVRK